MNYCCCKRKPLKHREIEKRIKNDRRRKEREIQLLLFGRSRSGKTTIFRQLQIIHGHKYSEEMLAFFAIHINRNIVIAIQALIDAMATLEIPFAEKKNEQLGELLRSVDPYCQTSITEEQTHAIKQLWADQGIQSCYNRKDEFNISDSARYFLDSIDRISQSNYLSSEEDIVRVDISTTEFNEFILEKGEHILRVTDFKRQRRIWYQFFENAHALIYVVDISVYDHFVEGTDDENEVNESKELFKLIVSHPLFCGTSFVLFLNKIDLFKEKIMQCHLAEHFPAYSGPIHDCDSAGQFLKQMFLDVNQERDRQIFSHFTCAIDKPSMARVYDNVIQSVIQSHVRRARVL